MNALVASVIRTIVPVIIGHVAAWLLLVNIVLPDAIKNELSLGLGGFLSIIYYIGVRVLEQQWPKLGVLLGLSVSPDSYSKGNTIQNALAALLPAPSSAPAVADVPAIDTAALTDSAPASTFPKDAVAAAVAAEPAPAPAGLESPIAPASTPTA